MTSLDHIIDVLGDFASASQQQRLWLRRPPIPNQIGSYTESVCMLFDDAEMMEFIAELVAAGRVDPAAIEFARRFEALIDEINLRHPSSQDEVIINDARWPEVMMAARRLRRVLMRARGRVATPTNAARAAKVADTADRAYARSPGNVAYLFFLGLAMVMIAAMCVSRGGDDLLPMAVAIIPGGWGAFMLAAAMSRRVYRTYVWVWTHWIHDVGALVTIVWLAAEKSF
jgi:hypothetical protein